MPYVEKFSLVEDYLIHLDAIMGGIADPFIQSRYLGFVVQSAVTAYELAIKEIFFDFADRKHVVLGNFARARFEQLNGRIKIEALKREHVAMFGNKYVERFEKKLVAAEDAALRSGNGSIRASYGNVIAWRHNFVHQGTAPPTTNYTEIKNSYASGKSVIHCLAQAMVR